MSSFLSNRGLKVVLLGGLSLFVLAGCFSKSRLKVGKTADGEVVEADGFAPNDGTDLINTKRNSLVDAQRNAVEKAVGVFVSARTLVEKAVAIENNILAKTDGYVKKYDILSEGVEGTLYKTTIRALVALQDLESDLRDMSLLNTPELERPHVTVQVEETINNRSTREKSATRTLERTLTENGFVVVTADRKDEAELNITGTASAFPYQNEGLGGFVSYRSRISLQVARPGTKDVLVSLSKEASGLGGTKQLAALKSLETVGKLSGTEISEKIAEVWSKGKKLLVLVEGVQSFKQVDRIKKHLSAQPGVKDLALRRYDDDLAQYEVQLGRKMKTIELATALQASQVVPLEVVESTTLSLRLKAK